MVLTEKLQATNQKAKHFYEANVKMAAMQWDVEEANRTLEQKVEERTQKLEQQKAELMAGKNKMEDLLNAIVILDGQHNRLEAWLMTDEKDGGGRR